MDIDFEVSAQELGVEAEKYAASILRRKGFKVHNMGHMCPFDLLINKGKRLEVKVARRGPDGWYVNLHRHGKLDESHVDAYVMLLDFRVFGKKKPLVLIVPAPAETSVMRFSIDSLLSDHHQYIENWSALGEANENAA